MINSWRDDATEGKKTPAQWLAGRAGFRHLDLEFITMNKEFKKAMKCAKGIRKARTPQQKCKRVDRWAEATKQALGA